MSLPDLAPGNVHVWRASLDAAGDPALLSAAERARAARAVTERARARFVRSRTILRTLLAGYAGTDPAAVRFGQGEQGKPFLETPARATRFNLSHAGSLLVLAVARDLDVGIDVERLDRKVDVDAIARRVLAVSEREALARVAPETRAEAFFRCWAAREATVKAIGTGMLAPSVAFEIEADPTRPVAARAGRAGGSSPWFGWWLSHVDVPDGWVGVLAAEREPADVRTFDYGS